MSNFNNISKLCIFIVKIGFQENITLWTYQYFNVKMFRNCYCHFAYWQFHNFQKIYAYKCICCWVISFFIGNEHTIMFSFELLIRIWTKFYSSKACFLIDPQKFNNQSSLLILINVIKHSSKINLKYQVRFSSYLLDYFTIRVSPLPNPSGCLVNFKCYIVFQSYSIPFLCMIWKIIY